MPQGQLIATVDCFIQEIILDIPGETVIGEFEVMFPDASTQIINGTLPLSISSPFNGIHAFWNNSIDSSSTVSSVISIVYLI